MHRAECIDLCGPTLFHISAAKNLANIKENGLLSASNLAEQSGQTPENITLRTERHAVKMTALLNHQRPLLMGRGKDFLDGHTLCSWAKQLDERIFLAPGCKKEALQSSFDIPTVTLEIDTGLLFDAVSEHLFLAPINTGNADRKPVWRGDWIYVPVTGTVESFKKNRQQRGLIKGLDKVKEVSLTTFIPPDLLDLISR